MIIRKNYLKGACKPGMVAYPCNPSTLAG
uniref:Macaca fascicularis brain cDNA clone: QbsA-11127, similar to human phosphatidylinositol-3-phosphate associated protein(PIP3AP), mRNA, RefSeq: NM_019061.2 n=1 Tax=Macaca fascicularis TaxID=9541 RepID=I7G3Z2_MACFA|nr:unnamed protein product [Macaca fascicularis]